MRAASLGWLVASGLFLIPIAAVFSQEPEISSAASSIDEFRGWQQNRGQEAFLDEARTSVAQSAVRLSSSGLILDRVKRQVADGLFALGLRKGDLTGPKGEILIQNMADAMTGRATMEQLASLAPLIVIGTVTDRVDQGADLGDGYLGNLVLSDIEVLKGQARGNDDFLIRLLSGKARDGSGRSVSVESGLNGGRSFLFFLSRDYYKTNASRPGRTVRGSDLGTNAQAYVSQVFLPLEVVNGQVTGAPGDSEPKRSIIAVRSALSKTN